MAYDPKRHHRRSVRLADYDYTHGGAYFVTICVQGRTCLFGDVVDGKMGLNDAGRMVQAVWDALPVHYRGVETDAFIMMPNHVHAIIVLAGPAMVGAGPRACPKTGQPRYGKGQPRYGRGQPRGVAPTDPQALSLGDVVHRFKSLTTNRYIDGVKERGWPPFAGRLWQRNYYESIIHNEQSLVRVRQYITDNPASWMFDKENPSAKSYRQEGPESQSR